MYALAQRQEKSFARMTTGRTNFDLGAVCCHCNPDRRNIEALALFIPTTSMPCKDA